jgi:hypothetical protein
MAINNSKSTTQMQRKFIDAACHTKINRGIYAFRVPIKNN